MYKSLRLVPALSVIFALYASPSVSAKETTRAQNALAAGYKAMFTCSATFNAGKTVPQIKAQELSNIYSDYGDAINNVGEPIVNAAEKYVSVKFTETMPPRIAAWREHLGCTALPQGADVDFIKHLPRVKLRAPAYDPQETPWPHGDTLPNTPMPEGINAEGLEGLLDAVFDGKFEGETSSVVILQNGRLVTERYRDGFDIHTSQRTWSVAKSIGASIIGAAVSKGYINVKDRAGLEAWSRTGDPRGAITLENLLHMNSGLESEPAGNRTDNVYFGGGLMAQYATQNHLQAKPGHRWRYANNDTMLAMRALREAIDNDRRYHSFAFTHLLHKIGMFHTFPEMDWGGDFILSSQVWTTARDLARLGQLYLNDGIWPHQNGKGADRILPKGWADYVASPASTQPPNRSGENASKPGRGYGAQFWRYENYPGVPEDTYAALGNRGQFLIIVPKRNTVIVRRGYDWRGNYFNGPEFTASVLAHLD